MKRSANRVVLQGSLGLVGFAGALACAGAMVLAAAGILGASLAAGMAGMSGMGSQDIDAPAPLAAVLRVLLDAGPAILLISSGAIILSIAAKHPISVLPAVVGGGILYWGMYVQQDSGVMYVSIAAGLAIWAVTYVWAYGILGGPGQDRRHPLLTADNEQS